MQKTQKPSNIKRSPIPKRPKSSNQPTTTVHQLTKKQLDDTCERARLAKIFTRLALATAAFLVVTTFFATTGLCDFALLNPTAPTKKAYADGTSVNNEKLKVFVESACTLSASVTSEHVATIANGTNRSDIGSTTLKTLCNDQNGYSIYAVGFSNDSLKTGNTNMLWEEDNTKNAIATGVYDPDAPDHPNSSWAMKLGTVSSLYTPTLTYASSYAVVPNTFTKVAYFNGITDQSVGGSITTTYQVYISPTQPAGTYTGKVKYTLVHPETKTTGIASISYMQDMTSALCAATDTGVTVMLADRRDGNAYSVSKLKDGKCWMTSNLDLNLDANTALTPSDSNVSADWTPERSTIPKGQLSASTWTNDYNHPYSYDSGNIANGNYYNWSAAIAMNDSSSITTGGTNATDSICPKGWRLPNAGTANEFGQMFYAHHVIKAPTSSGDAAYDANGFNILISEPLSFLRAGLVHGGSLYYVGSNGYYWSSTALSSTYARNLTFNSSYVYPQDYYDRYYGFSVRCVAI